jgi:hypothetical protein
MTGRVSVWRSPQIAPVYALVLAFAAAAVAGWLLGIFSGASPGQGPGSSPPTDQNLVTIKVSGDDLPKDLAISVGRAGDRTAVGADRTAKVAAGADQLCLRSEEPVRVAGIKPPTACVSGTSHSIEVEHVAVQVRSDNELSLGGLVTVGGNNVAIDKGGRYLPRSSLVGRPVCLTPPAGWTVANLPVDKDGKACSTPKDPLVDVVFEVRQ